MIRLSYCFSYSQHILIQTSGRDKRPELAFDICLHDGFIKKYKPFSMYFILHIFKGARDQPSQMLITKQKIQVTLMD